jgi:single-strand DNA-binding protein
MNKAILTGRLTADPTVNINGENKIARYTLAVDRKVKRDPNNPNQQTADFITCVAFGRSADFVDKYLRKGTKIAITGRIQTGRYTNKDGQTVYTTDVVVEEHEFCESKSASGQSNQQAQTASAPAVQPQPTAANQTVQRTIPQPSAANDAFINIPDNISMEVPFS